MTYDDPFWEQLARYFANEATDDERRLIDEWLAATEENRQLFRHLQQRWQQPVKPDLPESNAADVWERRIGPLITTDDVPTVRPLPVGGWLPGGWWRVAAAVAGLLLGGMLLYRLWLPAQPTLQVAQNALGTRSRITLPDGSRVWLNADSRLEFPKQFKGTMREVRLTGEAFFDVAHNPRQPFVIRLETASIRVLGTSFNVRAYPDDAAVKTTVVTGRVAFIPNKAPRQTARQPAQPDTLFLTPNQHVVQQTQTLQAVTEPVVAQHEAAWKDNRLVFEQTPMAEVARTLERWYGVSVTLERPDLARCPLTATFDGQSLPDVMNLLARTGRFQYTLTNQTLIIRGRGCTN
ncbi:FecR family protein [Spirosoma montaniterrae]|uniref:Iron dicitrate transport regulator FecR n=1 Tax=Spirosoma montaniterrae TaxID=1178516 RepID=A0A1P9WSC2_9BACT|nr:FecR domain-containing protein [Spirosoma montaniterrae]AQG78274.1 hypothetical protein AWR27_02310 [Spirosoma montaniterrae]